jgi:AcrR family transcriptional regulator
VYQCFNCISDEKKRKVIKACLEEFANNGFEKASTNVIVKNAGISKGVLFHYFENKKNLFLYILDYCSSLYLEETKKICSNLPDDIIVRLTQIIEERLNYFEKEPYIAKIMMSLFLYDISDDIQQLTKDKMMVFQEQLKLIVVEGIDLSKFRKDMDINKTLDVMFFTFDSVFIRYFKKYAQEYKLWTQEEVIEKINTLKKDMKSFISILKYGIYEDNCD